MFDAWEKRRQMVIEKTGTKIPAFRPLSEISKEVRPPSSEDRLEALVDGSWTPVTFVKATHGFLVESRLTASVHRKGNALPALGRGVILKYSYEYEAHVEEIADRDDLVVAVIREGDRVIGFASAELHGSEAEIKLVAVDDFSRRERGVQRTLEVAGETFGVGVGHAVIDTLMTALPNRMVTDATSAESRYIFKSFGFRRQPGASNPCLLQLER